MADPTIAEMSIDHEWSTLVDQILDHVGKSGASRRRFCEVGEQLLPEALSEDARRKAIRRELERRYDRLARSVPEKQKSFEFVGKVDSVVTYVDDDGVVRKCKLSVATVKRRRSNAQIIREGGLSDIAKADRMDEENDRFERIQRLINPRNPDAVIFDDIERYLRAAKEAGQPDPTAEVEE